MGLSVAGALSQKKLTGLMTDKFGCPMPDKAVRVHLKKAQFEGKKLLPMGDCDNFCYQNGCRGHGVVTVLYDWKWEEGNG